MQDFFSGLLKEVFDHPGEGQRYQPLAQAGQSSSSAS